MSKRIYLITIILLLASASLWAQKAITFSFASDDNEAGRNFYCNMPNPNTILGTRVPVDLMVDRNDTTIGGIVTIQALMYFRGIISNHKCINHAGNFLHIWKVNGFLRFYHVDNPLLPVLFINYYNAVLTSYSPSPIAAGETLTLEVSESVDPNINMNPMNLLPGIGVNAGNLAAFEDFALTFTNVTTGSGAVLISLTRAGYFNDYWKSEGSFSGSGNKP